MKYIDGENVQIGDSVTLSGTHAGEVVCDIDGSSYTKEFKKEDWGYLKSGVIIEFQDFGLIHFSRCDDDLALVERRKK